MENNIQVLSSLDLNKNTVYNAQNIERGDSKIVFSDDVLSVSATRNVESAVGGSKIAQGSKSIVTSVTDNADGSKVSINSTSVDITSPNITMSHPNQTSGIQFNWDAENNTLIIGKKSSN